MRLGRLPMRPRGRIVTKPDKCRLRFDFLSVSQSFREKSLQISPDCEDSQIKLYDPGRHPSIPLLITGHYVKFHPDGGISKTSEALQRIALHNQPALSTHHQTIETHLFREQLGHQSWFTHSQDRRSARAVQAAAVEWSCNGLSVDWNLRTKWRCCNHVGQ